MSTPSHYSRAPTGTILPGDGVPQGQGLDAVLDGGRAPLKAALEIAASIAELCAAAERDGSVHGDLRPGHVKLGADGVISLEGFGILRRATKAPEGRPEDKVADRYALGTLAYSLLAPRPLGTMPKTAEAYEGKLLEKVGMLSVTALPMADAAEARGIVASLLAWDPTARPAPGEVARTFRRMAAKAEGADSLTFISRVVGTFSSPSGSYPAPFRPPAEAVSAPGLRPIEQAKRLGAGKTWVGDADAAAERPAPPRTFAASPTIAVPADVNPSAPPPRVVLPAAGAAPPQPPRPPPGLGPSPTMIPPDARGMPAPGRPAPAAVAIPTASRPPQPSAPAPGPPPGQIPQRSSGGTHPHRPPAPTAASTGAPGSGFPPRPSASPPAGAPPQFRAPVTAPPAASSPAQAQAAPAPPAKPPAPPVVATPPAATVAEPPRPPAPAAAPRPSAPVEPDPFADPPPQKRSKLTLLLGGLAAAALAVFVCGGVAVGGAWWFFLRADPVDSVAVAPPPVEAAPPVAVAPPPVEAATPVEVVNPPVETAPPAEVVNPPVETTASTSTSTSTPASTTTAASTTPKTTTTSTTAKTTTASTTPKTTTTTSTASTTPNTTTTTDPEPSPDAPYTVRFSAPGSEATVQCGDGQVTTFASSRSLQFTGIVTCLVKIDSGKTVVQLDRAASVTCRASGSSVSCDK